MKNLLEQAFEAGQKWEQYQFREIDSALDFETWYEQLHKPDVGQRSEQLPCGNPEHETRMQQNGYCDWCRQDIFRK